MTLTLLMSENFVMTLTLLRSKYKHCDDLDFILFQPTMTSMVQAGGLTQSSQPATPQTTPVFHASGCQTPVGVVTPQNSIPNSVGVFPQSNGGFMTSTPTTINRQFTSSADVQLNNVSQAVGGMDVKPNLPILSHILTNPDSKLQPNSKF